MLRERIYRANQKSHFFKELGVILKETVQSNFIAVQLAKRDIMALYRQSLLGFFWVFFPIVSQSIIWLFLSESGAVSIADVAMPYPLFVIVGTTLWSIISDSIVSPINSVVISKGVISKINFPKEALFVSGFYKVAINTVLKLVLLGIVMAIYGIYPNLYFLNLFLVILLTFLLSFSIGVLLTPLGLLYTDIGRVIPFLLGVLMYASPVVYATPKSGFFAKIIEYNPLTSLIVSGRNAVLGLPLEQPGMLIGILVFSTALILIGLVIFRNSISIIIEKIS